MNPKLRPVVEKLVKQAGNVPEVRILKVKNVQRALNNVCARLKINHVNHRALRQCFVTRCIELGLDFKTVAGLQGHRDGVC